MLSEKISFQNKRILVCPLDWGLGHAARCVPLIKHLQAQNNVIIIGCNEKQKRFLCNEVSNVEYIDLFGYDVQYSWYLPLWLKMLFQFPRLSRAIRKENDWLADFVKTNKIDVVISDNRFGLFNKKVESVFITHQIHVKAPFLSRRINYINHTFIKKFNQCWIPDFEDKPKSLSGALSQGEKVNENTSYIGSLSRFTKQDLTGTKIFDVLILLSGVEPQRTLLEEKLVEIFSKSALKVALVRGTSAPSEKSFSNTFTVTDIASTKRLEELFSVSQNIICRSGYSSLMDLHALGLKAILIPTPGQTEQEYLAEYWNKKFGFTTLKQKEITESTVMNLLAKQEIPVTQI